MFYFKLTFISFLCFIQMLPSLVANNSGEVAEDGKIKGAVVDSQTKEPIEYATIALYREADNELITGTVTDFIGHFKIEKPVAGNYYLIITFIGFKEIKSERFTVINNNRNLNLGNFTLVSSSRNLDAVEVIAKRATIEYRIDKKVINVGKQITAQAGTAIDILENVPSVQVDIEGNVTLRGSSGFTVLIDGRPTILDPSDVLRQIPSTSIENIEIITNPSAKYEPDGATGIINIITLKNRLDGLSGVVNASAGIYGEYAGDLQMSYRMNKLNFVLSANHRTRSRPGFQTAERKTFSNDTSFFVESSGDTKREYYRSNIRAGIEYDMSKRDFISLSGRIGHWGMMTNSNLRYNDWTFPETAMFSYNSMDHAERGGNYFSVNGLYQRTFSKKVQKKEVIPNPEINDGKEAKTFENINDPDTKPQIDHALIFKIDYQGRDFNESITNELRDLSDELIDKNKNVEKGPSSKFRLNIDYTLPVSISDKFEAGMQWRSRKSVDITELWLYNDTTGELEYIDKYSHKVDYLRNTYAAYALYGGFAGNFGYQVGLRTEYTYRNIEMVGETPFIIDRWDYFPTTHLSYNLPLEQQIMASYSRRIDRPRGWWLEPFITWVDAYNVRQGNPAMKPEYIDSYEAGYLKKFNDNFFSLEAYYRITHNKIERISSVFHENVMLSKPENIGQDFSLGIEAMLNIGVFNWWDMEVSGTFFRYKLVGELTYMNDDEIISEPINRSSRNWNSRLNNTFKLWRNGELQLSSRYNSSSVTAQGTTTGYFVLDAAFKVTFLHRSLSANLQGRDILGTSLRERISEGPNFYTHYKNVPKSPVIVLTISYRFNNFDIGKGSRQNEEGEGEDF